MNISSSKSLDMFITAALKSLSPHCNICIVLELGSINLFYSCSESHFSVSFTYLLIIDWYWILWKLYRVWILLFSPKELLFLKQLNSNFKFCLSCNGQKLQPLLSSSSFHCFSLLSVYFVTPPSGVAPMQGEVMAIQRS